jgi:hypothetical protein
VTSFSGRLIRPCNEACSLFILDKGKPVARPGRKASGQRKRRPDARVFQPETPVYLSDRRSLCVTMACSLFILDKGKPVARPGRKAKGRRIASGGSLVAERMFSVVRNESRRTFDRKVPRG